MKKIGEIYLTDLTFLSDPCLGTEDVGNCVIRTIPGYYDVYITRSQSREIGFTNRVSNIIAFHRDYGKAMKKRYPTDDSENLYCAVDSGTCGIFNANYYDEHHETNDVHDDWYEENVIKMDDYCITDEMGAICSSGLGDGCYDVFAEYKEENAYALRIKFL